MIYFEEQVLPIKHVYVRRKNMRKAIVGIIVFMLVAISFAGKAEAKYEVKEADVTIVINDEILELDVSPVISSGRTLVPLRSIFEFFDVELEWEETTQTIKGSRNGTRIILPVGQPLAAIDEEQVELDVPALIVDGRTMVPSRFIAESLGAEVIWHESNRTVEINLVNKPEYDPLRIFDYKYGLCIVAPSALGVATVSKEEMANLDDNPAELRERINSAADLFLYLDIAEYQGRSGDTHVQDGNITWHHNNPVNITIKDKRANCGGAANLAMYLLGDDYEEMGYLHYGREDGGHIINYIVHEGQTYIIDFMQYIGTGNTRIFNASLDEFAEFLTRVDGRINSIIAAKTNGENFVIGYNRPKTINYYPPSHDVIPLYLDGVSIETREHNQLPAEWNRR
ncbi:MAG: copper amine oxidase N-terminal domain-containing protein [bacterium]